MSTPLEQLETTEHPLESRQRIGFVRLVDRAFFLFGTAATAWLGYLLVTESFTHGWQNLWFIVIFWVLLAYLLLPRIHQLLTVIYVPDYFIGRARTREGLLGDPVNLSLFGTAEQVHTAMRAAGWNRADEVSLTSGWRIVMSTIMRRSYSDAPVSPLYLFGNVQDFTYQQEVAGNPAQRHHVRFWRAPDGWLLPGGIHTQWLAAGTYDRSVGLSLFTLQVTHKIDADTDVERDHIVSSITQANPDAVVTVIRNFSTGYHAVNGGGDAIATDGDLPQVDLRAVTVQVEPVGSVEPVAAGTPDAAGPVEVDAPVSPVVASPVRRPISIYLGVLLILLRSITTIGTAIGVALDWKQVDVALDDGSQSDVEALSAIVFVIFMTLFALAVVIDLVVARLIFRGGNRARFVAMALAAVLVIGSGVEFFVSGTSFTLENGGLIGLSLDILVLVALSSDEARDFTTGSANYRRTLRLDRRLRRLAARGLGDHGIRAR